MRYVAGLGFAKGSGPARTSRGDKQLTDTNTAPALSADAAQALFAGEGEMRARCRAMDWAATPLGPVETWPAVLRWTVRTAMESPFPINLWCGPELVLIYNDGYRHVLGSKHPAALARPGSEVWSEVWREIAPMFEQIRAGGPPVYADDAPFVMERAAGAERIAAPGEPNAWFTFALSPVRDDDGSVVAYLNVVSETTGRVLAERAREAARADALAAEARLRQVFEQAPAAILITEGPDHVPTVANPRYRELVGGRDLLGRPVRESFPELDGQGLFELMDRVYATGEAFVGREMPVRLDRAGTGETEEGFYDFVYQPLSGADGRVFGIMVHVLDATDEVRARRHVEATAAERSAILTQIADGVVLADAEGRISFVNQAGQRILGITGLGTELDRYSSTFRVLTPAGDPFPNDQLPLVRAVQRGETVIGAEWISLHPDGTRVQVQGSAAPVLAEDGGRLGAVLSMRDVTEERRLQRQIEAERGRLAETFRQAPAFIATLRGPDHVFETTNPLYQQLVGYRDVIGKPVREALPEVVEQGFIGLLDGVYRSGEPFIGQEIAIQLQSAPGGGAVEHFLNFVYQPIRDAEGTITGIFVHAVDVTEQVRARQAVEQKAEELARLARALEATNRELDQFAYVASHDLKAPLRGIANLSQWIEDDLADRFTAESREHMRLLHGRVHRMEALIDGILQYSRAGRTQEPPERVDTAALLDEVVDLLAPPDGVDVVVQPGMPVITTERLPLQQVFMNLVGNAVKYGGPGARVEVSAQPEGGGVCEFTVRDDGPGIAPEYHERIFTIFQTLEARDKVEGTGIGLSIVKKMVESRGGRVWVDSAPGRGAAFRFTWPARPDEGSVG
jgi:PAS domain S-box-containing protein